MGLRASGPPSLAALGTSIAVVICSLGAGLPFLSGSGTATAAAAPVSMPNFDLKAVLAFSEDQLRQVRAPFRLSVGLS